SDCRRASAIAAMATSRDARVAGIAARIDWRTRRLQPNASAHAGAEPSRATRHDRRTGGIQRGASRHGRPGTARRASRFGASATVLAATSVADCGRGYLPDRRAPYCAASESASRRPRARGGRWWSANADRSEHEPGGADGAEPSAKPASRIAGVDRCGGKTRGHYPAKEHGGGGCRARRAASGAGSSGYRRLDAPLRASVAASRVRGTARGARGCGYRHACAATRRPASECHTATRTNSHAAIPVADAVGWRAFEPAYGRRIAGLADARGDPALGNAEQQGKPNTLIDSDYAGVKSFRGRPWAVVQTLSGSWHRVPGKKPDCRISARASSIFSRVGVAPRRLGLQVRPRRSISWGRRLRGR